MSRRRLRTCQQQTIRGIISYSLHVRLAVSVNGMPMAGV